MSFERARAIADAVLLEGYVLYPYRASALKNRYRWSFGVLAPRAWSEAGGGEPWRMQSQLLVEAGAGATLTVRLRFLQLQRRRVEEHTPKGPREVDALDAGGRLTLPWDEGITREVDVVTTLKAASSGVVTQPIDVPAAFESEEIEDEGGARVGRVTRACWPVRGVMNVHVEPLAGEREVARVTVSVENHTRWDRLDATRDDALRSALLSTHLLMALDGGAFLSLMDPPPWAKEAAELCHNVGTWPVLAGEEGGRDLLLSSPIILYDHPQIAPESPGDFFDASEIDELLTLRTQTLTDDEKRQVRATDERSAQVLARVEGLPREWMERLHGAVRELAPIVAGSPASAAPGIGSRVRLKRGTARTDAQDLLYAGRVATVEKVEHDVDGRVFVGVTIDDDPAADLNRWYGRFHYYTIDEVELLAP